MITVTPGGEGRDFRIRLYTDSLYTWSGFQLWCGYWSNYCCEAGQTRRWEIKGWPRHVERGREREKHDKERGNGKWNGIGEWDVNRLYTHLLFIDIIIITGFEVTGKKGGTTIVMDEWSGRQSEAELVYRQGKAGGLLTISTNDDPPKTIRRQRQSEPKLSSLP